MKISTGGLVAVLGAALVVLGTFLPLTDASELGAVVKNSLVERDDAIWVYLFVVFTLASVVRYEFSPTRDNALVIMLTGAVTFILFGFAAQGGTLDVYAVRVPGETGPREFISLTQNTHWGIGPIMIVIGSFVTMFAGYLCYRSRDLELTAKQVEEREAKENAPLPEAKLALPKPIWRLIYVAAIVAVFVPIVVATWNLPELDGIANTALMFVIIGYAAGAHSLIRRWLKEEVVPRDAPNAPPRAGRAESGEAS